MAETAVGSVIDKLIPLLTEEANLLRSVHKEVAKFKRELQSILAFLKDADRRAEDEEDNINYGVKVWVEELREVAFQIENVIDEYTHHVAQKRQQHEQRSHRRKLIGLLQKIACFIIRLKPRHDTASTIQDLKQAVREINERSQRYGFNSTQQGSTTTAQDNVWYDPRNNARFLQDTEVVGIESARDELMNVLERESPSRIVILVVGMGGLGKTTLAHQAYVRAKGRFDYHAWIEVSKLYNKVELLRSLMKKFCQARKESAPEGIDAMNEETVTTKLRDYLQGKRYFVVFDDIWNISFWADVANALPGYNGSIGRIIITTRDVNVADFCRISSFVHLHELQPLPWEKAWELFCNKAFLHDLQGQCPTHLRELSDSIVKRCEGLPLAIVVLAGLLSTKNKTLDEWRKLSTSLSSELVSNRHLESITKILSLSYYDLPYYLKSCFLYFGIFPEDYSIRHGRLIRQWIAEGFVKPKKDKPIELVAEEYLVELINRSLVQVSEVDFDGKAKTCRIHDLLRDIILKKMEDLSFCRVFSRNDSNFKVLTRRISLLHNARDAFQGSIPEASHVRSLFIIDSDTIPNSLVQTMVVNFNLLKVLDFEDAPNLDHLPKDIGDLFHLRYLSLRGTRVRLLPTSIGKLINLETLDLKLSLVYELPVEINKLSRLRYLLVYNWDYTLDWSIHSIRGVKIPKGIGRLKSLQKLYFVDASIVGVDVFKELRELTELRKLGMTKLRSEDGTSLSECLKEMKHLECLDISSTEEEELIDLESMSSSPPLSLRRLYLKGHLRKLPDWIPKLQNLVRIRIRWSKLEENPLKSLQNLPNLLELGICQDAYCGKELHFEKDGFPQLKVLSLYDISSLNSLAIAKGALRNLENFNIGNCPQLEEVPSGFQHLRNLKDVLFFDMPIHFLIFQNFECLQCISLVRFVYNIDGRDESFTLPWVMKAQDYILQHADEKEEWAAMEIVEIWRKMREISTEGRDLIPPISHAKFSF
ncbi:hypothetical protein TIFTF001_029008 [Ficus carica]|uniref:Disease resistance protein RPM1-like n=1 Tax=Ficus carica TaxID=3494 RepID=A0AA88J1V5_FICCA|nr:hypothetical protein TIFTF001_029008 [Ficus carica]